MVEFLSQGGLHSRYQTLFQVTAGYINVESPLQHLIPLKYQEVMLKLLLLVSIDVLILYHYICLFTAMKGGAAY